MNNPEAILKDLLDSDGFDELVVYRLKISLDSALQSLEDWYYAANTKGGLPEHKWDDYVETLSYARSLLKVLEWFSVEEYTDTIVLLNKYSLSCLSKYFNLVNPT